MLTLGAGVIVLGQILKVGLDGRSGLGDAGDGVFTPKGCIRAVAFGQLQPCAQDQGGETAAPVGLDGLDHEQGRSGVRGVADRERLEGTGRVVVALLFQVELAQVLVDPVLEGGGAVVCEIGGDGLGAGEIGERQADGPAGVLQAFTGCLANVGGGDPAVVRLPGVKRDERLQRRVVAVELEIRPAPLVQRGIVEARALAAFEHGLVGRGGLRIAALHEQAFGAAELGFRVQRRPREIRHQAVQGVHGLVAMTVEFIGAGQLIKHLIRLGIVRIVLQQLAVDARGVGGRIANGLAGGVPVGGQFQLQVRQPAHGFGPQRADSR